MHESAMRTSPRWNRDVVSRFSRHTCSVILGEQKVNTYGEHDWVGPSGVLGLVVITPVLDSYRFPGNRLGPPWDVK